MKLVVSVKVQHLRNCAFLTKMQRQHRFSGNTIQKAKMSWSNLYFNPRVEEKEIATFHQLNFILNKQRDCEFIIKLTRFKFENLRIFSARQNIVICNKTNLVCERKLEDFMYTAGKTALNRPNYFLTKPSIGKGEFLPKGHVLTCFVIVP